MTPSFRFAGFRLDPATRELWRADAPVAVPPRAFDCIVYLVEHRDRAVGRDELIAAVWGRADITDGLLGQTVLAARRALDDTGKDQHFIRTVVRFGYHWVAATERVDAVPARVDEPVAAAPTHVEGGSIRTDSTEAATHSAIDPQSHSLSRRIRHWRLATAAVLLIAVAAAIVVRWRAVPDSPLRDGTAGIPSSIALVLPVVVTAESGFDWVRLGMMDLIAGRLRRAGLPVVPSDNVVALTGSYTDGHGSPDPAALAAATGASLIIEARAEHTGARWRVFLRTIRGRQPRIEGIGESTDALAAARLAADNLVGQLGYVPITVTSGDIDAPALVSLLQEVEAATLSDHLDSARSLLAGASPVQRAQPEVRLRLAQIDYQAGDFAAAESAFQSIADTVSSERDRVLHARALSSLGVIAAMRDDEALATRRFDEAISLLRGQGAPDALGKALIGRANVAANAGRLDAALQDFAEARIALESAGNLVALAVLDSNLAALDLHRERYAEAEPMFRRATERFATFGMKAAELNSLTASAEIQLALLDPAAALAQEPRLHELIAQVSDPARQRYGELTRLQILAANGRLHGAEEGLALVIDAATRADDHAALARAHALAAQLALERGEPRKAATEATAALKGLDTSDDPRGHARVFMLAIDASIANAQPATAVVADLAAFAARNGSAAVTLYARLGQAASAADNDAAAALYAQALDAADTLRIPLDLRETVRAYATWLMARGDLARASALGERLAGAAARDYDSALLQLRIHHALGDETLWRNALVRARSLAGERTIPAELLTLPTR